MRRRLAGLLVTGRIIFDLLHSLVRPRVLAANGSADGHPPRLIKRAAASPLRDPVSRLKIISWNIHRNYQPDRIQHSLHQLVDREDPDLILLQEVPVYSEVPFWELDGVSETLREFQLDYTAMHLVRRQSRYYPFEHTGLATLSRIGTADARAIPLPTVSRPKLGKHHTVQRVALVTKHQLASRQLHVVNVHLENTTGPQGRSIQARHLVDEISNTKGIVVLGGDFNTLFGPLEAVENELDRVGFRAVHASERRAMPRLDHFFVLGCTEHRGRRLRAAGSDHQPIAVELVLSRDSRAT